MKKIGQKLLDSIFWLSQIIKLLFFYIKSIIKGD
jgi:hypothetical protein